MTSAMPITRALVVETARGYVGTPYHHQAAVRGAGCDCLGLVRGVWRDIYGAEPEAPPPYTPDWGESGEDEHLLDAATRHMIATTSPGPGDVLIFRLRERMIAKHVAILSFDGRMIHAQSRQRVCEVTMSHFWAHRVAGAFSFPGIA